MHNNNYKPNGIVNCADEARTEAVRVMRKRRVVNSRKKNVSSRKKNVNSRKKNVTNALNKMIKTDVTVGLADFAVGGWLR